MEYFQSSVFELFFILFCLNKSKKRLPLETKNTLEIENVSLGFI